MATASPPPRVDSRPAARHGDGAAVVRWQESLHDAEQTFDMLREREKAWQAGRASAMKRESRLAAENASLREEAAVAAALSVAQSQPAPAPSLGRSMQTSPRASDEAERLAVADAEVAALRGTVRELEDSLAEQQAASADVEAQAGAALVQMRSLHAEQQAREDEWEERLALAAREMEAKDARVRQLTEDLAAARAAVIAEQSRSPSAHRSPPGSPTGAPAEGQPGPSARIAELETELVVTKDVAVQQTMAAHALKCEVDRLEEEIETSNELALEQVAKADAELVALRARVEQLEGKT